MITTVNPFHNPQIAYSRPSFLYDGKALFTHRDVYVYKNPAGSWDHVFAGMTIAQLAGFLRETVAAFIDDVLDGRQPRNETICAHLRAHGHSPKSYAELP